MVLGISSTPLFLEAAGYEGQALFEEFGHRTLFRASSEENSLPGDSFKEDSFEEYDGEIDPDRNGHRTLNFKHRDVDLHITLSKRFVSSSKKGLTQKQIWALKRIMLRKRIGDKLKHKTSEVASNSKLVLLYRRSFVKSSCDDRLSGKGAMVKT